MKGLWDKYTILHSDGTPVEGKYFILNPEGDPIARMALRVYALQTPNKELAKDLLIWLSEIST